MYFYFEILKKSAVFLTKMFTKWLKNFRWMNTRVGKGFFEEKMANLKVFIAKVGETYRRYDDKQVSSSFRFAAPDSD